MITRQESEALIPSLLKAARRCFLWGAWTQGAHARDDEDDNKDVAPDSVFASRFSLLGAILAAIGEKKYDDRWTEADDDPLLDGAIEAVLNQICPDGRDEHYPKYWPDSVCLVAWNDVEGRTEREVVLALKGAWERVETAARPGRVLATEDGTLVRL